MGGFSAKEGSVGVREVLGSSLAFCFFGSIFSLCPDPTTEVLGSSLAFCFFGSIFSLCPDPTTNRIFRRVVSRYLKREQGQQRELTLSGEEFVRRYLTHIVAKGFMRIRHYGFLANCCRKRRLTQIRRSLDALPPPDNESKNRQPAQHHPAHGATPGI